MQDETNLTDILNTQSEALRPHFKPEILQRSHTIFAFQFELGAAFYLEVTLTSFRFIAGVPLAPTITVYIDRHETCWQLLTGQADSMAAFMDGRYRADGNIVLSQLLLYLFKSIDPSISYEVRD